MAERQLTGGGPHLDLSGGEDLREERFSAMGFLLGKDRKLTSATRNRELHFFNVREEGQNAISENLSKFQNQSNERPFHQSDPI